MNSRRTPIRDATTAMLRAFAQRIERPTVVVRHLVAKPELTYQDRKSLISALINAGFTHYTK